MPPKIFILLIIPNLIEFANANLLNELKFYILLKNKNLSAKQKGYTYFILPVPVTRWITVEKSRQAVLLTLLHCLPRLPSFPVAIIEVCSTLQRRDRIGFQPIFLLSIHT